MKNKYNIGDIVYKVDDLEVKEYKISGVLNECGIEENTKYSIQENIEKKSCIYGKFLIDDLYKNKEEIEAKLAEAFNEAKFKVGDIVVYGKRVFYITKLIYNQKDNIISYDVSNRYDSSIWSSNLSNLNEKDITKIN